MLGPIDDSEGRTGAWPLGPWISTVDYRLVDETTGSIDNLRITLLSKLNRNSKQSKDEYTSGREPARRISRDAAAWRE